MALHRPQLDRVWKDGRVRQLGKRSNDAVPLYIALSLHTKCWIKAGLFFQECGTKQAYKVVSSQTVLALLLSAYKKISIQRLVLRQRQATVESVPQTALKLVQKSTNWTVKNRRLTGTSLHRRSTKKSHQQPAEQQPQSLRKSQKNEQK